MLGLGDEFTVMAALREEIFGMSLLKISATDFITWNLGGDRRNGNPAAVTVVEAVDLVHVPRAAASGADGELAGEMRFGASDKRCCLLVPYANPWNLFALAKSICDSVQRVAGDSVNSIDSRFYQNIHEHFRYILLSHCFVHPNPEPRSPDNWQDEEATSDSREGHVRWPRPSSV